MIPMGFYKLIFLAGLIAAEAIRFPHRMRNKRERRQKKLSDMRTSPLEVALDLLAFSGMEIFPLIYIFSTWLSFADYRPLEGIGLIGAALMLLMLWLLWKAHVDLGVNWSPTVEIREQHALVTKGVYGLIRHPIYAAMWLWGIAQALLLPNWIAGLGALVTFLPVYLIRVPREEKMMLDHFGEQYRDYMSRTGQVIPKLWN